MKYAIISDIHSNFEALKTVFDYIDSHKIENIVCLGDVVGYGPRPNECVKMIRDKCQICIVGNHDHAVLGLTDIYYFNQYARDAVIWTRAEITQDNLDYLNNLPYSYEKGEILFVHSTPINPAEWDYILSDNVAREQMRKIEHRLVFIGHSHVPIVFSNSNGSFIKEEISLNLENDKYIVNVGSVGQPRNEDPRSCFVIFDDLENTIRFIKLEYDIKTTSDDILARKLPPFLASRLLIGF